MAYKEGPNPVADPVKVGRGVKMFAEVEGKGKPMMLVHGFGLTHEMWKYQIPYLTSRGYHVVAVDLRGFGESSNMPASYTYDTWAKDLGKAIDKFERDDVTLVGYSLGGAIAMHYMATHRNPPVERLALIAAAGPYMTWSKEGVLERMAIYGLTPVAGVIGTGANVIGRLFNFDIFGAVNEAIIGVSKTVAALTGQTLTAVQDILRHWACVGRDPAFFDALVDLIAMGATPQLIPKIYANGALLAEPTVVQWIEDMLQSSSPEALIGALEEMRNQDLQDSLKNIAVPTTIVGGMLDVLVPPWLIAEQFIMIQGAEHSMLPGGHGLVLECADALNQALAGR
ncbi:MAG TPA: alpha/beta hydrolase [Candidatus Bathyarchaeia archaeon]|nr:alpha/beta hydrolase [Candidatus Bathyarchaeia archaeon]